MAGGAVAGARSRGQQPNAIDVCNGGCMGGGKGPWKRKVEPRVRGECRRGAGIFCRTDIDGINASLQLVEFQIN